MRLILLSFFCFLAPFILHAEEKHKAYEGIWSQYYLEALHALQNADKLAKKISVECSQNCAREHINRCIYCLQDNLNPLDLDQAYDKVESLCENIGEILSECRDNELRLNISLLIMQCQDNIQKAKEVHESSQSSSKTD